MNKIFEPEKKHKNYDLFYQDREVFPDTLRTFVKKWYDMYDYEEFVNTFRGKYIGKDMRHPLWIAHIQRLLNTTMVYPDGYTVKVKHLPFQEILRVIDYAGYEIGMASYGHGNDTLLGIFKKYGKEDWLI